METRSLGVLLLMAGLAGLALVAVPRGGDSNAPQASRAARERTVPDGTYGVQRVEYDDATGQYRVHFLETPAGSPPYFEGEDVRMARLTDEDVAAGKHARMELQGGAATLWLEPDHRISYIHNVTETQADPATGQQQVVVVRQESSFWTPFAASMAGSMMANALFAPSYVYPPVYATGALSGVGSYGATRQAAAQSYQANHGTPPKPARLAAAGGFVRQPGTGIGGSAVGAGSSRFKTSPRATAPRPVARPMPRPIRMRR